MTHDLGVVSKVCHRAMVIYAGQIVEEGDVRELFSRPLHPYTEGLLGAMPEVADQGKPLRVIPGWFPPSMTCRAVVASVRGAITRQTSVARLCRWSRWATDRDEYVVIGSRNWHCREQTHERLQ